MKYILHHPCILQGWKMLLEHLVTFWTFPSRSLWPNYRPKFPATSSLRFLTPTAATAVCLHINPTDKLVSASFIWVHIFTCQLKKKSPLAANIKIFLIGDFIQNVCDNGEKKNTNMESFCLGRALVSPLPLLLKKRPSLGNSDTQDREPLVY